MRTAREVVVEALQKYFGAADPEWYRILTDILAAALERDRATRAVPAAEPAPDAPADFPINPDGHKNWRVFPAEPATTGPCGCTESQAYLGLLKKLTKFLAWKQLSNGWEALGLRDESRELLREVRSIVVDTFGHSLSADPVPPVEKKLPPGTCGGCGGAGVVPATYRKECEGCGGKGTICTVCGNPAVTGKGVCDGCCSACQRLLENCGCEERESLSADPVEKGGG